MKKFYLHNGAAQEGPFDIEDLKAKHISRSTPIWYEALPNWTIAGEVDELKQLFVPKPPPFIHQAEVQSSHYNGTNRAPKSGITLRMLLYVAIIIVVALIGVYIYNQNKQQITTHTEADAKAAIRNNIASYVKVGNSQYLINSLGGISGLSITVANNTNYMLDNVRVQVSYIKVNGEILKNENIDFPYLEAYKQVTLHAPNSTRGTSISYKIVSIKSTALGLY